jgi:hypothetical protein
MKTTGGSIEDRIVSKALELDASLAGIARVSDL